MYLLHFRISYKSAGPSRYAIPKGPAFMSISITSRKVSYVLCIASYDTLNRSYWGSTSIDRVFSSFNEGVELSGKIYFLPLIYPGICYHRLKYQARFAHGVVVSTLCCRHWGRGSIPPHSYTWQTCTLTCYLIKTTSHHVNESTASFAHMRDICWDVSPKGPYTALFIVKCMCCPIRM